MPNVTRVIPGTVDVRISDAAQWKWKHVQYKTDIKFANIDFESGLCWKTQMINKLIEHGKNNIFY